MPGGYGARWGFGGTKSRLLVPVMEKDRVIEQAIALQKAKLKLQEGAPKFTAVDLFNRAFGAADPWQQEFLLDEARRILLLCSRQSGKSTALAVKVLARARAMPHSLHLLIGPTLRQAQELFEKASDVLGILVFDRYNADEDGSGSPVYLNMREEEGVWRWDREPEPLQVTALRAKLRNGSRIIALPGSKPGNVRGYSGPATIAIDEAAWAIDGLFHAILPMLAVSGGQLILASTPFGQRGYFYEAATAEEDPDNPLSWRRYEVPWTLCPRISKEFIESEMVRMGAQAEQEYLCKFLQSVTSPFDLAAIDRSVDEELLLW